MAAEPPSPPGNPRDQNWARPVSRLHVSGLPAGAINLNVDGRQLTGPVRGFGQMWQKTYSVPLAGAAVAPEEVVRVWKAEFPTFWPPGNRFYRAPAPPGLRPGDVAVLNLAAPGGPPVTAVSTGIMVIYADDVSFSFMTPEGHMFAGMITFSAFEAEGATVAQVVALIRASDPFYELIFRLPFGHKTEDSFWHATLRNLAARFGAQAQTRQQTVLVDPRVRWREARALWHNAALRTAVYLPVALAKKAVGR